MEINPTYLRVKQAHQFLNISRTTFYVWLRCGILPQGFNIGKRCRMWNKEDLIKAMQKQEKKAKVGA